MEKGLFSRKKLYSIPFSLPSKIIWDFDLPHARICWLRCTGCITNLGTAWWIHSALMYKVTKNDKKKREKRNAEKPEHTKWAHSVLNCLQVIFISADKDNNAPIYCYCSRTRELSSFYGIPLQVYNVQIKMHYTLRFTECHYLDSAASNSSFHFSWAFPGPSPCTTTSLPCQSEDKRKFS